MGGEGGQAFTISFFRSGAGEYEIFNQPITGSLPNSSKAKLALFFRWYRRRETYTL